MEKRREKGKRKEKASAASRRKIRRGERKEANNYCGHKETRDDSSGGSYLLLLRLIEEVAWREAPYLLASSNRIINRRHDLLCHVSSVIRRLTRRRVGTRTTACRRGAAVRAIANAAVCSVSPNLSFYSSQEVCLRGQHMPLVPGLTKQSRPVVVQASRSGFVSPGASLVSVKHYQNSQPKALMHIFTPCYWGKKISHQTSLAKIYLRGMSCLCF